MSRGLEKGLFPGPEYYQELHSPQKSQERAQTAGTGYINVGQMVTNSNFHLLSHKASLNKSVLSGHSQRHSSQPRPERAFAKNQASQIVGEAQSLKSRQICRGLIKINQSRFQLR